MKRIGELKGELEVFEDDEKYKFVYDSEECSDYILRVSDEVEFRIPIGESTFTKSKFGDVPIFVEHEILTCRLIINKKEKENPIVISFSEDVDVSEIISFDSEYDIPLSSENVYINGSDVVIENAVRYNEYCLRVNVKDNEEEKTVDISDITTTDVNCIDLSTFGKEMEVEIPEGADSNIGWIKVYHFKNEPYLNGVGTESGKMTYNIYIPVPSKISAVRAISKEHYRVEYNPQKDGCKSVVIDDFEEFPDRVKFELDDVSRKEVVSVVKPSWFVGSAEIEGEKLTSLLFGKNEYHFRDNKSYKLYAYPQDEKTFCENSSFEVDSSVSELSVVEGLSVFSVDVYLDSYNGEGKVLEVVQDDKIKRYIVDGDSSRISVSAGEGFEVRIKEMNSDCILSRFRFDEEKSKYSKSLIL